MLNQWIPKVSLLKVILFWGFRFVKLQFQISPLSVCYQCFSFADEFHHTIFLLPLSKTSNQFGKLILNYLRHALFLFRSSFYAFYGFEIALWKGLQHDCRFERYQNICKRPLFRLKLSEIVRELVMTQFMNDYT